MRMDGRSQNAAMMLMRQKPGQRGSGGCDVLGRLESRQPTLINDYKINRPLQLHKLSTFYIPMS